MHDKPIIRDEAPADVEAIAEVTVEAFRTLAISQHTEHFIVAALRAAKSLAVSLVAELDGKVVGHIAFSPVTWSDGTPGWYGLGPVSVAPALQRQGIGGALIRAGLERLGRLHAGGCCRAACRTLAVGAPGPILAQGKARRSAVWLFQTNETQRRHAPQAAPALRVGRLGGVYGVAPLANGTTIRCATRLASIRPDTQRIPQPKSDRLLIGHPAYYPRFGFRTIEGLSCDGVPPEVFLALPLSGRMPRGTVTFHPGFFVDGPTAAMG